MFHAQHVCQEMMTRTHVLLPETSSYELET